ncbi:ATP synthase F1 subunit epsilon [Candidatus Desantisbacteria bacterium CG2_30_40_21]|uniref:ATP synthase epsilon chain n=5 Tax=unclassified Candidatus Desantisiibacteriota TaxID=3106372 RepID=A0A2M7JBM7_9BACT|nr:MAG: ATP synthase F1 subunit epsilon [Candidatus Desantisbacteria bacterium CG2_30_40_21]PIP40975.1 MAG: ATP synthase F1 subunit epsilon [Candidatus Desantisbacteria bacterium CG23_combo_of_CG06-09_8_20_14_all_40_23]PIX16798.1 MAG: ATP synthase F1 subunit epsilon [Candidatus Desantisbacteria bacterium CG_4_8_14_3_um_filter_40_12]PIY19956.1 MAG: ATP synthase F1 subunit epsilon [Candidatus Desantisbacteria bacterium CG_4_10_14_3_um_filter_40_18]PJB29045.1 MAG: ATP synthase F1 subunit epsilon [
MSMDFKLITPERIVAEGQTEMIIAPGNDGELGVLSFHTPILSTLKAGKIQIKQNGNYKEFDIDKGFIEVSENKANILTHRAVEVV